MHQLEGGEADEHDGQTGCHGELEGLQHPVGVPGTVVEGHDGDDGVVDAEQRHEEEGLELEIDAEDAGGGLGEALEDLVDAEIHAQAFRDIADCSVCAVCYFFELLVVSC